MRDDSVYLEYIEESMQLIEDYLATALYSGQDALFKDLRTQDAVLRRMETLGEATTHLSDELKARHPQIDWRKIADFRNRLAHGYVELRLDLVWDSIANDLPALKALIAREQQTSGALGTRCWRCEPSPVREPWLEYSTIIRSSPAR